jgi:hypothetical protein
MLHSPSDLSLWQLNGGGKGPENRIVHPDAPYHFDSSDPRARPVPPSLDSVSAVLEGRYVIGLIRHDSRARAKVNDDSPLPVGMTQLLLSTEVDWHNVSFVEAREMLPIREVVRGERSHP